MQRVTRACGRAAAVLVVVVVVVGMVSVAEVAAGIEVDSAVAAPVAPGPATFARVDAYVAEQLEQARIPGAAVAVVQGGRTVHARGYGSAGDAAMTARTPVLLGSLTKSITAVAIMQLVEAGRVDLDAPVQRYLPAFRMADQKAASAITVRHLLSHTSGIPPRAWRHYLLSDDSDAGLAHLANLEPYATPGLEFRYSNPNYALLGAIIEVVSGQPYERYVHEKVLGPIGMSSAYASMADAGEHGLATGYQYFFGWPVRAEPSYGRSVTPAGFISASAQDMGRYLGMLLGGGAIEGSRVLGSASVSELFRPQIKADESQSYGLGWFLTKVHGRDVIYHTGSTPDATNTYALMVPGEDWGFVVLVNAYASGRGPQRDTLAFGVRDLLMQREPDPVPTRGWGNSLLVHAALIVLQLAAIAHTVLLFRRWRRNPQLVPAHRLKRWAWHVALPALGCVALAGALLMIPGLLDTSLANIRRDTPDVALLIALSVVVAVAWGLARTLLATRLLTQSRPAAP